jgi:hypothetical protein
MLINWGEARQPPFAAQPAKNFLLDVICLKVELYQSPLGRRISISCTLFGKVFSACE